jgi:hypothetical protein
METGKEKESNNPEGEQEQNQAGDCALPGQRRRFCVGRFFLDAG